MPVHLQLNITVMEYLPKPLVSLQAAYTWSTHTFFPVRLIPHGDLILCISCQISFHFCLKYLLVFRSSPVNYFLLIFSLFGSQQFVNAVFKCNLCSTHILIKLLDNIHFLKKWYPFFPMDPFFPAPTLVCSSSLPSTYKVNWYLQIRHQF